MSLTVKALARASAGSPVRNAVRAEWAAITEARKAGASLNAIFRELRDDGLNVGAGYSSFRNAVRYLDENPPGDISGSVIDHPSVSKSPRPEGSIQFGDDRFTSDWGDAS